MILWAARILVTVLSVTYWQQCLSLYTNDHPQVPFTGPDSTSKHTNQVSDTVTSISHSPFQIIFLEEVYDILHAFLDTDLKAIGWTSHESRFDFRRGQNSFSSPRHPDRLWGPPRLLFCGHRGVLSQRVKRQGRKANHAHNLVWRLKMCDATPPFLHVPSWRAQRPLGLIALVHAVRKGQIKGLPTQEYYGYKNTSKIASSSPKLSLT